MKSLDDLAAAYVQGESALTIGVFDGVHLGHRHLLEQVKAAAREQALASVVITFANHPQTILAPEHPMTYICTVERRLELLRQEGIDYVVPLTFTRELSELTAREFVTALVERLRMRHLVAGPDFCLGRGRDGTIPVLEALGEELGYSVTVVAPYVQGGRIVSSTAVRQTLAAGQVRPAGEMLGRAYSLTGPVVLGARRGHTLGFPTANIDVTPEIALPADGVYCTVAWVEGQPRDSVTNIGVRPTFGELRRTVETHLLDFAGDLYDQTITIDLIERIRPERRFSSVDELVVQMGRDVEAARGMLAARVSP